MKNATAIETSLSSLSHHDWCVLQSRWCRGSDYYVEKIGKKWAVSESFGRFPLFATKKAACEAATRLILMESDYRASRQTG